MRVYFLSGLFWIRDRKLKSVSRFNAVLASFSAMVGKEMTFPWARKFKFESRGGYQSGSVRKDQKFSLLFLRTMYKNLSKVSYSSPDKTCESPKRHKIRSIYYSTKSSTPQLPSLSEYRIDISASQSDKITVESLVEYLEGVVENVYQKDPLKIAELISDFVLNHMTQIRQKVNERLSLTHYLSESLRYKQFGEIDAQMQREWRKNILMMSLGTIWSTRMENHKFVSVEDFLTEYKKFCEVISNFTYFYFKSALTLLERRKVNVFNLIQEETAHGVIDSLPEWLHLYDSIYVSLLMKKNMRDRNQMNMDFDVQSLLINKKYIDISSPDIQLTGTIEAIKAFSVECTILKKIQRLKEVRAMFLKQIELSRQEQERKLDIHQYSPLEKDDIIGCMIYCIVKGEIFKVQVSLQALSELLGPQCEFLSRKGVDSYRADLESAVQFLVQENQPEIITVPQQLKERAKDV